MTSSGSIAKNKATLKIVTARADLTGQRELGLGRGRRAPGRRRALHAELPFHQAVERGFSADDAAVLAYQRHKERLHHRGGPQAAAVGEGKRRKAHRRLEGDVDAPIHPDTHGVGRRNIGERPLPGPGPGAFTRIASTGAGVIDARYEVLK